MTAPVAMNDQDGGGGSGLDVIVRTTRQVAGGAVTVVGSVGYTAGDALEGAGTVLNATADTVGGTVVLLGDVLEAVGKMAARVLTGLGTALTLAGRMIDGRSGPGFLGPGGPAPKTAEKPAPKGSTATVGTKARAKKPAKKDSAGARSEMEKMGAKRATAPTPAIAAPTRPGPPTPPASPPHPANPPASG